MRVADYIAKVIKDLGSPVFMLAGGNMMHLMDGLRVQEVPYVCCHHENTAGLAAVGYAKANNNQKLGVCFATNGPGATNLMTAITEAYVDSTPVLFIVGQCRTDNSMQYSGVKGLRQVGISEVDVVSMAIPITKSSVRITEKSSVIDAIHRAIHEAMSGRPGPVLVEVPLNIQAAILEDEDMHEPRKISSTLPLLPRVIVSEIVQIMQEAKRPVLLLGKGAQHLLHMYKDILLNMLELPIVTTCIAKDVISYDNPLFVGHVGLKGDIAGNHAIQEADVILSLGQSFHTTTIGWDPKKFAPNAKIIQVDIDPTNLHQTFNLGLNTARLHMDINDFAEAFLITLAFKPIEARSWLADCIVLKEACLIAKDTDAVTTDAIAYNVYEVMDELSDILPSCAIVITDAGSAYYAGGQGFKAKKGQTYISSAGLGAMGHAIPMALGAAIACPYRPVYVIVGDGSFCTAEQVLPLLQNKNVTIIVLDNKGYLSIRNTQDAYFEGNYVGADKETGVDTASILHKYMDDIPEVRKDHNSLLRAHCYFRDNEGLNVFVVRCLTKQAIIRTENK